MGSPDIAARSSDRARAAMPRAARLAAYSRRILSAPEVHWRDKVGFRAGMAGVAPPAPLAGWRPAATAAPGASTFAARLV